MAPQKTIASKREKTASGRKVMKTRLTFMPCANKDGSNKITMMLIGTAAKPRAFPKDMSILDIFYRHSKNAWMTRLLFAEWFHGIFVPEVRQYSTCNLIAPKAILLLDNCSAHHFGTN